MSGSCSFSDMPVGCQVAGLIPHFFMSELLRQFTGLNVVNHGLDGDKDLLNNYFDDKDLMVERLQIG